MGACAMNWGQLGRSYSSWVPSPSESPKALLMAFPQEASGLWTWSGEERRASCSFPPPAFPAQLLPEGEARVSCSLSPHSL